MKRIGIFALAIALLVVPATAQITIRGVNSARKDTEKTKNIHGIVQDAQGKPVAGARVQIRNTKDNTIRIATSDDLGNYSVRGLPPDVDYEVRADSQGRLSDAKLVSALLDREDNLVNFQLSITAASAGAAAADPGTELKTFDLVNLRASFELPRSVPAPIPGVLLLHGYGENRKVWDDFRSQLLAKGWAVMTLDLRGHGDSTTKNQRPLAPSVEWRSSPHEFPHDIDPALDFMKSQPRLDSRKIVVIGYDLGANLALVASGKFKEIRTVVAVKPSLNESLSMAGSAQDFHPRSAFIVMPSEADANALKALVQAPVRVQSATVEGGTREWFQSKAVADAIFQWLKETY